MLLPILGRPPPLAFLPILILGVTGLEPVSVPQAHIEFAYSYYHGLASQCLPIPPHSQKSRDCTGLKVLWPKTSAILSTSCKSIMPLSPLQRFASVISRRLLFLRTRKNSHLTPVPIRSHIHPALFLHLPSFRRDPETTLPTPQYYL